MTLQSTAGYAQEAPALFKLYETISPEALHRPIWHLLPTEPSRLLDIGAGTGRDAAHFAAMGHRVLAVEPVEEMREGARRLHPSPRIEWLADTLPTLARVQARGEPLRRGAGDGGVDASRRGGARRGDAGGGLVGAAGWDAVSCPCGMDRFPRDGACSK
jgi:SAM-dependent methyltransferase